MSPLAMLLHPVLPSFIGAADGPDFGTLFILLRNLLPGFIVSIVLSAGLSLLLKNSEVVRFFRLLLGIALLLSVAGSLIQWWRWHAMVSSPSFVPPNMGFGEVFMLGLFPALSYMVLGAILGAFLVERRFAAREKARLEEQNGQR